MSFLASVNCYYVLLYNVGIFDSLFDQYYSTKTEYFNLVIFLLYHKRGYIIIFINVKAWKNITKLCMFMFLKGLTLHMHNCIHNTSLSLHTHITKTGQIKVKLIRGFHCCYYTYNG